jgi:hypothetical protein
VQLLGGLVTFFIGRSGKQRLARQPRDDGANGSTGASASATSAEHGFVCAWPVPAAQSSGSSTTPAKTNCSRAADRAHELQIARVVAEASADHCAPPGSTLRPATTSVQTRSKISWRATAR